MPFELDLDALERPEPGWERLHLARRDGTAQDWLADHPDRVRFACFRAPGGGLVGRAWFGPACQGPPGHAHGGALASLLDLVMGGAAWASGYPVVAAKLEIGYRRSVPLGRIFGLRAAVDRREGRDVFSTGAIVDDEGRRYVVGGGRFVVLRKAQLAAFREQQTALGAAEGVVWADDVGLEGELADGA
jgi:acyl-coenzyme A thioesterase PaaI-like protein